MSEKSKNPKVSVIIPVYNVEKYLDQCVQSVLRQTLSEIEIILVDDGSTDHSGMMCDMYKEDERVRVIHKKNGGLSDARNAGVEVATADYVGFVDSDDYIETDMYELLYKNIQNESADISLCGLFNVYATGVKAAYSRTEGYFIANDEESIQLVLHGKDAAVSAVNKLYKKSMLKRHPFLVGKTYEDAHFIIPYLTEIKKAVFDMTPKYYYVHREGTITTRPFNKTDLSIVEAYENNRRIIQDRYPDLIPLADFRYYWALFYVIDKMMRTNSYGEDGEYKMIVQRIRNNYKKIVTNQHVGKGRKIAVTGLMIHRKLYELCLRAYVKKNKQLVND